jgi:hypothetical protein
MLVQALLRGRFLFLTCFSAFVLAGCQSLPPQFQGLKDTWDLKFQPHQISEELLAKLPNNYEFLIVHAGLRPTLLVLDKRINTTTLQGDVIDEYWYSADRELVVLRNGRIHTVFGMPTEWRANQSTPPSWHQVLGSSKANAWTRTRQEMPNYRYNIQDKISTQALSSPPALDNIAKEITSSIDPNVQANLKWVQDSIETTNNSGAHWSYTQVFAVDQNQVVYSEQCISATMCLRIRKLKY